jgi:hypothetical protein
MHFRVWETGFVYLERRGVGAWQQVQQADRVCRWQHCTANPGEKPCAGDQCRHRMVGVASRHAGINNKLSMPSMIMHHITVGIGGCGRLVSV